MRNVLIPTDFSRTSLNACDYALQFFQDQKCNFHFLYVVRPTLIGENSPQSSSPVAVAEKLSLKTYLQKLHHLVEELRKTYKSDDYRFFTSVENDYFVDAVRKQLIEKHIDFIVMGTTGSSDIKKMLIGSNTTDIITKVKCTTLVIPEHAKFNIPKEIAFPSDFSSPAPVQNLEPLLEIMDTFDASLKVIYINGEKNAEIISQKEKNRAYFLDCFHDHKLSFFNVNNGNLEEGIGTFTKSNKVNMIALMAKKLNFFHQLLFKPHIDEVTFQTNVPFLILHE